MSNQGQRIAPNQGENEPPNQGQNDSPNQGQNKTPNQGQNAPLNQGQYVPLNQGDDNSLSQSHGNQMVGYYPWVAVGTYATPGHKDPNPSNYRPVKSIMTTPGSNPLPPSAFRSTAPATQPTVRSMLDIDTPPPAGSCSGTAVAGSSSAPSPASSNPQPRKWSMFDEFDFPPEAGSSSAHASSAGAQTSSTAAQTSSTPSAEKSPGSHSKGKGKDYDDDPPDPGLYTSASSDNKAKSREPLPLDERHGNEMPSSTTGQPSRSDKGTGSDVSSDQRRASEGSAATSPPASPAGNLVSANEIDQAISNASTAGGLPSAMAPSSDLRNIVRRKLTGYVGFANLPNQWHRKSVRKGFNFNVMVVGESGLGKSTLVNTLFNTSLYPPKERQGPSLDIIPKTVTIQSISADIEEAGVRLRLTVVDTPGFGDFVNNDESWRPIVDNIEQRYDAYLDAENKVNRMNIVDNRIHACVFFIQPTGHSLKPLDIEVMRRLHTKVNLIPVIAKADTLTDEEIANFKSRILADIKYHGIQIFEGPRYELDDEETIAENNEIMSKVPFAVVGATNEITNADGRKVRGRSYPWGVIEVDNEEHCDFVKLRQMLIRTHMEELKEHTNNSLYENYRTDKLIGMGVSQDPSVFKEVNPAVKQEEERALHEQKLAKMEAEMKMVFQQKVAEKESKLKQSEEELYSRHREMKEQLERQRMDLEEKKQRVESGRPIEKEGKRKGFSLR